MLTTNDIRGGASDMTIRLNVLACAAALALCGVAQAQNVTVKSYSVSPSIKMKDGQVEACGVSVTADVEKGSKLYKVVMIAENAFRFYERTATGLVQAQRPVSRVILSVSTERIVYDQKIADPSKAISGLPNPTGFKLDQTPMKIEAASVDIGGLLVNEMTHKRQGERGWQFDRDIDKESRYGLSPVLALYGLDITFRTTDDVREISFSSSDVKGLQAPLFSVNQEKMTGISRDIIRCTEIGFSQLK